MRFKNYLLILIGSLILAIAPHTKAYADDILKGAKTPTNWQFDQRVSYSSQEKKNKITGKEEKTRVLTTNTLLKYRSDGDKLGVWGFTNLPYKSIDAPTGKESGIGDFTIGVGPRGRFGNLYWQLYTSLTMPTGETEGKVPLGNGRTDLSLGLLSTYLTDDQKFEIDGALEYKITGENKLDINPPNELYGGLLAGGKLTEKIRFATGVTGLLNENHDYVLNSRTVLRYTFSKRVHLEAVFDKGLESRDMPKGSSIGIFVRYNF